MNLSSIDWRKLLVAIFKYAAAALAGGVGVSTLEGCASVPMFIF